MAHCCLLATCYLLLATCYLLLPGYLLLATCYCLATCYLLRAPALPLSTCHSLLPCYLQLATCYCLPLATCHSLLPCYLPLATCSSRWNSSRSASWESFRVGHFISLCCTRQPRKRTITTTTHHDSPHDSASAWMTRHHGWRPHSREGSPDWTGSQHWHWQSLTQRAQEEASPRASPRGIHPAPCSSPPW